MCLEISFIAVHPDASKFPIWHTVFTLEQRSALSLQMESRQHSPLLGCPRLQPVELSRDVRPMNQARVRNLYCSGMRGGYFRRGA